jgi:hypothetical protein
VTVVGAFVGCGADPKGGIAVAVFHELDTTNDPPEYSSVRLTGVAPFFGRVLVRTYPNPTTPPSPTFEDNTITTIGVNMNQANEPDDTDQPMARMGCEGSFNGSSSEQSEWHWEWRFNGTRRRPVTARTELFGDESHISINGNLNIATTDGTNVVCRFDVDDDGVTPGAFPRMNVDPSFQIATNTGVPVKIRGVEITGGEPFIPQLLSQSSVPVPDAGGLLIHDDTDDDSVWIIFEHPTRGTYRAQMTLAP